METEPIWYKYVVYDEEGDVSGVRDDAPQNIKDAYNEYMERQRRYKERNEPIPR